MVCSVFVCSLWKAAGLFGKLENSIQCTEFHNWDVYSLKFFGRDDTGCGDQQSKDIMGLWGDGVLIEGRCHIMGDHFLDLSGANTKIPYQNMAQKCPSKPPRYFRPKMC